MKDIQEKPQMVETESLLAKLLSQKDTAPTAVDFSRAEKKLLARLEGQHSTLEKPNSFEVHTRTLTAEERALIKEESGWSDEIINALGSIEEYEIYISASLVEVEIGGKKCLITNDIDWEQQDSLGRTNKERAQMGLSPINKDGKVIELHHIGQHPDSPLAELTPEQHRGKGNDAILHDKTKESEIDRQAFASERSNHWEARSETGDNVHNE